MIAELSLAYPNRDIRYAVHGVTSGQWDASRLAQVTSNLLGNALANSPEDSPVEVVVRGSGQAVSLCVNNLGRPIPADQMPHLFDPFKRAGQSHGGKKNGLGLGLFIAKSIVDAHGGAIEVTSTEQSGTTFTMRLPRQSAESAIPAPRSAGSRA